MTFQQWVNRGLSNLENNGARVQGTIVEGLGSVVQINYPSGKVEIMFESEFRADYKKCYLHQGVKV
jgi:hypothetical protein